MILQLLPSTSEIYFLTSEICAGLVSFLKNGIKDMLNKFWSLSLRSLKANYLPFPSSPPSFSSLSLSLSLSLSFPLPPPPGVKAWSSLLEYERQHVRVFHSIGSLHREADCKFTIFSRHIRNTTETRRMTQMRSG